MNEDELKKVGTTTATQDNRGGQYPMYVIETDERRWVEERGDWDERERIEDTDTGLLCESCAWLIDEDNDDPQELPDECNECDWGAFHHFKLFDQFELMPGIFFTEQAAQEHINENSYHYNNPRVYGIGAWRNPELQAVQKLLIGLSGQPLPSTISRCRNNVES